VSALRVRTNIGSQKEYLKAIWMILGVRPAPGVCYYGSKMIRGIRELMSMKKDQVDPGNGVVWIPDS
jgi:hypothetical protein